MANKQRNFKRMIALALALCSLALCACQNGIGDNGDGTNDSYVNNNTDTSDSGELFKKIYDDRPQSMDFNEEEIRMVIREESRYSSEFIAEDMKGSVVSNAVYVRNTEVKERLNVTMDISTINNGHGPWDAINISITSGACDYDVAIGSAAQATKFALNGSYRNLRNLKNINLQKEYWSQGMVENMTLADATYFATGSISTYFYDSAFVVYFNRELCDAWDISPDSLYECVMDEKWTLEKMISLTKDIHGDTNGDGIANKGDVFGFGLQVTSATDGFFSSCDISCTQVKNDGNLKYSIDTDKLGNVVKALNDFLWNNNGVVALAEDKKFETEDIYLFENQFANDQLLFVTDWLYSTSTDTMRSMESDFGVLPYPKYSEEQERYYTYAHDRMSVVGVPITVNENRLDMVGAFIEAMASGGQNTVMPKYYEKALTGQYIRDRQSVETMDIIVRNISNDRIWFLYYKAVTPLLREQVWYNKSDYVSTYQSNYSSVDLYLGSMHSAYEKYANQ